MRDILVIGVVVLCSLVALRRPVFGMLAFVCLSLLNPHGMTWGIGRTFPFAQVIAIGTLVGYCFWSEPKRLPRQRESILLLALWGMFGISTLFALYPTIAFERFVFISKILLMVFLSTSLINTEQRLHLLLYVIALSLGFHGVKAGIFSLISGGNYMVFGPDQSFLAANNSIGLALAMNVPLLFYLLKIETRPWLRWIMRAMLALSYPAVICTFSRGAWLGLAAVTAVIVLQSERRFLIVAIAGLLGIVLLPFLLQRAPERLVKRYDDFANYKEEASAQSRLWNWEFCARVGLAHPLHGGGFEFYSSETYAIYFPEFLEAWPGKVWSCHSAWFTIFGEHGYLGILLWIGLIASCGLSLRQMRSIGRTHAKLSWVIHHAHMLQGALIGYMVAGTFLDVAYFDLFYQLVAVCIIVKESMHHIAVETPSNSLGVQWAHPVGLSQKQEFPLNVCTGTP